MLRIVRASWFLAWIAGCATARPAPPSPTAIAFHLPTPLELERNAIDGQVRACVRTTTEWFARNGFAVPRGGIITEAYIFDDRDAARMALARRLDMDSNSVPATFAGTVDGSTLLVVTPDLYREIFMKLYPDEHWSIAEHEKLMIHEIAHAVHARLARDRFGTEDAMGPRWFFEGLAIDCAGQFPVTGDAAVPLSWVQIADLLDLDEKDALPPPIYPTYARIFRSLQMNVPVSWLIDHAGDADFADKLRRAYLRDSKPQ